MKKRNFLVLISVIVIVVFMTVGCGLKPEQTDTETDTETVAKVDYSIYEFTDITWMRETEADIEYISFSSDGKFSYFCACGNSVNDADVVESYSYDHTSKRFTLNCLEEIEGMITELILVSCDEESIELDIGGEICKFVREDTQTNETETEEVVKQSYTVDYMKISPMIVEHANEDVIIAAKRVIEAFLNYENSVDIQISGNKHRFLNDMGYMINATCPMFSAFTNYSEVTSYDENTGILTWDFYIAEDEFHEKIKEFSKITENYLSVIDKTDSEAMRAILLYYAVIKDASYDYDIIGENYANMSEQEYAMRASSYYVLTNKSGICTNISQALMFLYTQADLECGTVSHMGGAGAHMWPIVKIDGNYYYCDPTWDIGASLRTFGITASDRSSWAGGYAEDEGTMFSVVVSQTYKVDDTRFEILRQKVPVEITGVEIDKMAQTITFLGYEYAYTFECLQF